MLARLAGRLAATENRSVRSTFLHAIRLPVLILSLLLAAYLASLVLRVEEIDALKQFNWGAVDLWLTVAATLVAFFIAHRVLLYGVRLATYRADPGSSVLLQKILGAFFFVIAVVTALKQFSIDIAPVLASLGVAALAVALALQDTLGNYFAGITLALDKPIRPGDFVRLEGGLEGVVQTIGWRTTHIKPFNEAMIVVPNSKLANSILTNTYYPDASVRVYVEGGVSYESDLDLVEATVITVAQRILASVDGGDAEFEPLCQFTAFADSNITFRVILRAMRYADGSAVKHAFIKELHRTFKEQNIEMNYPVRRLIYPPDVRLGGDH